jgi:hypothetical protein
VHVKKGFARFEKSVTIKKPLTQVQKINVLPVFWLLPCPEQAHLPLAWCLFTSPSGWLGIPEWSMRGTDLAGPVDLCVPGRQQVVVEL